MCLLCQLTWIDTLPDLFPSPFHRAWPTYIHVDLCVIVTCKLGTKVMVVGVISGVELLKYPFIGRQNFSLVQTESVCGQFQL